MNELGVTTGIMLPMLILLGLGVLLRKIGWFPANVASAMNKLIFKLFLPIMLFNNMRSLNTATFSGIRYPLYLFLSVAGIFGVAQVLVPRFVHDPRKQGVMVQGIFRSNFAILGIPLMEAMFPTTGSLVYALAMPVVIPLNNVLAVITLSASSGKKTNIWKLLRDMLLNPLIIGCALGALCLAFQIHFPTVVEDSLNKLAGITSTLSLLVLGASLKWQGVKNNKTELVWTVLLKQLIIPAVMMTLSVLLGFRMEELAVMIILFGAPDAVSSFPMADAMGGDSELAAGQVVLTTVFSMGSLFAMIFIGKLLHVL